MKADGSMDAFGASNTHMMPWDSEVNYSRAPLNCADSIDP